MGHITTSIHLSASPAKTWHLITDFKNYPNWNPFFLSMGDLSQENLSKGRSFTETIAMPFGPNMSFPMVVSEVNNETSITFSYHRPLFAAFLMDEHTLLIEKDGDASRFTHIYRYTGILYRLAFLLPCLKSRVRKVQEKMNQALNLNI